MSPAPFSDVYRHPLTVPAAAIDANGHVNNVAYLQWMQDAAILHFESLGGVPLMLAAGASWVARSHRIEYLRPAFQGERLVVRTWIADMERARSRRCYEVVRADGGEVLATGETDWVFVDSRSGRPKRIADEIRTAARRGSAEGGHGSGGCAAGSGC